MINNFGGKSFFDALKCTKGVLDSQNNQSSLTQMYLSNTDIDVCNTVLYGDEPHIAVIDPEGNRYFDLDKKIFITKCIEINKVEDYRLILTYIYNILTELKNQNKKLPDTLIIPYRSNNSPNALVLENCKGTNNTNFANNFLYDVNDLAVINNGLKPSSLSLEKNQVFINKRIIYLNFYIT